MAYDDDLDLEGEVRAKGLVFGAVKWGVIAFALYYGANLYHDYKISSGNLSRDDVALFKETLVYNNKYKDDLMDVVESGIVKYPEDSAKLFNKYSDGAVQIQPIDIDGKKRELNYTGVLEETVDDAVGFTKKLYKIAKKGAKKIDEYLTE